MKFLVRSHKQFQYFKHISLFFRVLLLKSWFFSLSFLSVLGWGCQWLIFHKHPGWLIFMYHTIQVMVHSLFEPVTIYWVSEMSVYYKEWQISKTNQFSGISVEIEHFMWQLYIMQQHGDIARLEKSVSFIAH